MRKFKIASIITFLSCLLILFENCSMVGRPQGSGGSGDASLALQGLAMKVIQARCISCHNAQMPSGGVDYLTNQDALLYYRLVVPGEPELSYLYTLISDGEMPPPPDHLPASEVKAVYDWIKDGFSQPGLGVTPPTPPATLGPTFASINRLILQPKCLGCHNSGNSQGGVSFSSYASTMNTVQPGNINASSLYTSTVRPGGDMPRGSAPLSSAEMSTIQTWIVNGAMNN